MSPLVLGNVSVKPGSCTAFGWVVLIEFTRGIERSLSMARHPRINLFMQMLAANPNLRNQIAAPMNATLLYAGDTTQNNPWRRDTPVYRKIQSMRLTDPLLASKKMLSDIIINLPAPGTACGNLLRYAENLDQILKNDGVSDRERILTWRALSGIYASNARGAVSFIIGEGVSTSALKVFALTEIHVIERNPQVDSVTRDMAAYLKRCVLSHRSDVMVSLIRNT